MRVLAVLFVAAMLPGCAVVYQDTSCVKLQERTRPSDPVVRNSPRTGPSPSSAEARVIRDSDSHLSRFDSGPRFDTS